MKKGKFIVFEGLDGSGISTQTKLLEKYLKKNKKRSFATAEPTNNVLGKKIREILTKKWKLSNTGMQLLFGADRALHLETEILPRLKKGVNVISSRYLFSTLAFGSLNNEIEWLENINKKFPLPDLTFFLRTSPRECIKRIDKSRQKKEFFEEEKKLSKVIKTYDRLVREKRYKNFFVINGEQSIKEVHQDILKIIDKNI